MLFFGSLFLFYLQRDFSVYAGVEDAFWRPIWLFSRFRLPVLSEDLLVIIQVLWKAALGLSCLGLFTRLSTVTSFLLGIYLLGLPHNFGKTDHSDAILVFVFGVMALSRCSDSLSVDRLLWGLRHGKDSFARQPIMSGEYTWPVRVIWLVMTLIFFGAGMSKVRHSGIEWVTSDNMAILMLKSFYQNDPLTSWGLYIVQHRWLCSLLSAATIVFEVGYPLALFSRRARWIVVPAMASIQMGIRILMGISFRQFLICNLFWVPWDRVGLPVRIIGVIGIIMIANPDWVGGIARLAGIEGGVELGVYLGVGGVSFFCLIYYATLNV
jgi:hypothetical protein